MHTPVLLAEVLELLDLAPGLRVIDATVGCGGHAIEMAKAVLPGGRLLGVDCDDEALEVAGERLAALGSDVELVHGNFRDLARLVDETGFGPADRVLFDLGTSALQLDRPERGFSLVADGPLDMRMDRSGGPTAADVLRRATAADLEQVLRDYGDERYARRIARAIVEHRGELRTTGDLARLIERVVPRREPRIHPATRAAQSIRMLVNRELEAIEAALRTLPVWLAPGGRAALISFHSGQDRLVKQAFRAYERAGVLEVLTRKPVRPTEGEVARNRRARSAKLRVAVRSVSPLGG